MWLGLRSLSSRECWKGTGSSQVEVAFTSKMETLVKILSIGLKNTYCKPFGIRTSKRHPRISINMFPSFSCLTVVWEKCLEALESQIMLGESLLVHGIAKPSSEQSEACAPSNWMRETRESLDLPTKSLLRDSERLNYEKLWLSWSSRRPQSICQRRQGGACLRHKKSKRAGIP